MSNILNHLKIKCFNKSFLDVVVKKNSLVIDIGVCFISKSNIYYVNNNNINL